MKRFTTMLLAALLPILALTVLTAGTVVTASASVSPTSTTSKLTESIPGCLSGATWKASHWYKTQTTASLTFDPMDALYQTQRFTHHGIMRYWLCQNGSAVDKVKFDSIVYCAVKQDGKEAVNMKGMKWNTYMNSDNNNPTNPPEDSMQWLLGAGNDQDGRCSSQNFDDSNWIYRGANPYWKLDVWVNLFLQPDDHVDFTWPSPDGHRHYLGFGTDPNVDVPF